MLLEVMSVIKYVSSLIRPGASYGHGGGGCFEGVMPSVNQKPKAFTAMIIKNTSTPFARKFWHFFCLGKSLGNVWNLLL